MELRHPNRTRPGHEQGLQVLEAGLSGADPRRAVRRALRRRGGELEVRGLRPADGALAAGTGAVSYDLEGIDRIWVVGAGKAASEMARGVEAVVGSRIHRGLVVTKDGYRRPTGRIEVMEAGHPVPDARSVEAGRRILEMCRNAGGRDLVVCLISGGGSALMECPADGISLEDLQQVNEMLVTSGVPIAGINAVRKHLSALKGGRLADAAVPAQLVTLVVSDVIGNPLDAIASGPTVGDTTRFADALEVVDEAGLRDALPGHVVARLEAGRRGEVDETPDPDDAGPTSGRVAVVADRRDAVEAARDRAREAGWETSVVSTSIEGKAREAARRFVEQARRRVEESKALKVCVLGAGETTVDVAGRGIGGRNQEFAVAAAMALDECEVGSDATDEPGEGAVAVGALATDGTDGPAGDRYGAAGGLVDAQTVERGDNRGLEASESLARNDSYHYLEATGDLITAGPTGTNVNDLYCLLFEPESTRDSES